MYKFLLNCPEPPAKKKQKLRSIDVMIRKLDCSVTTEQKNYLNQNLKKIQKSDENLRAELTHILLTRQHNA